jgi:hypothetical protein
MQPPAISVDVKQPQVPKGEEPTKDSPPPGQDDSQGGQQQDPESQQSDALLKKWGKKLLDAGIARRELWQWKRRGIILKVLKNKEMLKGNQNLGTFPGSYEAFDANSAFDEYFGVDGDKDGDKSMDRRPHNFYGMLEVAYEAALSGQVPKTRARPANADEEADRQTARAFSRIEEIIERANKIKTMLRQELMEFFTGGCYFKHTRYVVDADRTGTHKETVFQMKAHAEVLPPRYQCFQCGSVTPEDELIGRAMRGPTGQHTRLACPKCGSVLGPDNYFEAYIDPEGIPIARVQAEVPNGMVLQTVYSAMNIDADPDAAELRDTCLLNCAEEVSLGWLRLTFNKWWQTFTEGESSGSTSEQLERLFRDVITAPQGYAAWFGGAQIKPTYNRTWFSPMFFGEIPAMTQQEAQDLQKDFPDGCMLAWVGDHPLYIRPAKLTDEWSWAGTRQRGFGLFPAPAGDPAVPLQEKLNEAHAKIDEYLDRLALGLLLANEEYIDTAAFNQKSLLPGVLNGVKLRKNTPNTDIRNMVFQVKAEIDALVVNYISIIKQEMELLVGTPPQTFGAGTQEGVDTASGQEQQLNTGMTKLGLHWEVIGDEHAEAAENAVKCTAKNMTDDWQDQVMDEKDSWRAEYVHTDEVKGSVRVERDTEQGFPMTAGEIRAFWQDVIKNPENPFVQALLAVPENVDECIRALAIPGMKAPKGAVFGKMLRYISQLLQGKPSMQPDPVSGEPMIIPSVQPNKYLDDCSTLITFIPHWCDDHWDQLEGNQAAIDNMVGFYKMCVVYEKELAAEMQLAGAGPGPAPPGPGPKGKPQPQGAPPAMATG